MAKDLLSTGTARMDLLILALPQSNPRVAGLIRESRDEGCPLILFDTARSLELPGPVAYVSRPYTDEDLDVAFTQLALHQP